MPFFIGDIMRLLFLIVLFFSSPLLAGELKVLSSEYFVPDNVPSCKILSYRALQREKMIRELTHIKEIEQGSEVDKLMKRNYLHINKEFLDHELAVDEVVEVSHLFKVSDVFKAEIESVSLENTILKIDSVGMYWKGPIFNFPDDVEIIKESEDTISIHYKIYLDTHCKLGEQLPLIEFIPIEENETPNTEDVILELS